MSMLRPRPAYPRLLEPRARDIRAECPECGGRLAVLRFIPGRGGAEYWPLRCEACGGIQLDIIKSEDEAPWPDAAE